MERGNLIFKTEKKEEKTRTSPFYRHGRSGGFVSFLFLVDVEKEIFNEGGKYRLRLILMSEKAEEGKKDHAQKESLQQREGARFPNSSSWV